eukprot:scaffold5529_cov117-Cylindrotheca_fusiformis.AAC.33
MDSLSIAVAQDAMVELQSSLVISIGQTFSCIGDGDSIWTRVISHCQDLMEEETVCTMSLLEVLEDRDNYCDLLNSDNKDVAARHVDMKGAILENLTEIPINAMPGLLESLSKRKRSNSTIIGTISLWDNAVSYEQRKTPSSQITCVEMVGMIDEKSGGPLRKPEDAAVHRKGTVSLGRALRQLLLHATVGTEPVISYRETTLTKVLQRTLESSKIVLLASVSQLSKDYEFSLTTLNYLRRLLVKPGKTASSPFQNVKSTGEQPNPGHQEESISVSSHSKLHDIANKPFLLEQIVTDPRQRLAKIFKSTPVQKQNAPIDFAPSEEEYLPIDYMDYDQQDEEKALQIPDLAKEALPNNAMTEGFNDELDQNLLGVWNEFDVRERSNEIQHGPQEDDNGLRRPNTCTGRVASMERTFAYDETPFVPDQNFFQSEASRTAATTMVFPGNLSAEDTSDPVESPLRQYAGDIIEDRQESISEGEGKDVVLGNTRSNHDKDYAFGEDSDGRFIQGVVAAGGGDTSDNTRTGTTEKSIVSDETTTCPDHNVSQLEASRESATLLTSLGDQGPDQRFGAMESSPRNAIEDGQVSSSEGDNCTWNFEEKNSLSGSFRSKYNQEFVLGGDGSGRFVPVDRTAGAGDTGEAPGKVVNYIVSDETAPGSGENFLHPKASKSPTLMVSSEEQSPDHRFDAIESPLRKYVGDATEDGQDSISEGESYTGRKNLVIDRTPFEHDQDDVRGDGGVRSFCHGKNIGEEEIGTYDSPANHGHDCFHGGNCETVTSTIDSGERRLDQIESPLRKYIGDPVMGDHPETPVDNITRDMGDAEHGRGIKCNTEVDVVNGLDMFEWNSDQADEDGDLYLKPQHEERLSKQEWMTDKSSSDHRKTTRDIFISNLPASRIFSGGARVGGKNSGSRTTGELGINVPNNDVDPEQNLRSKPNHHSCLPSAGRSLEIDDAVINAHSYNAEIEMLEGAVNHIQTLHKGLWESSATSLKRVRDCLQFQHSEMKRIGEEKEEQASSIACLKDDLEKLAEEHGNQIQDYELEVRQLHERLDQALIDKGDVEKIADEAISCQACLEEQLRTANDDLLQAREDLEAVAAEKVLSVKLQEDLRAEVDCLTRKLEESESQQKQYKNIQRDQELSIEHLQRDRRQLAENVGVHESQMEGLRNQLRQYEASFRDLRKQKEDLEVLRKDDRAHVESLESNTRHLEASLLSMEKEKTKLEDLRRRDATFIQELKDDVRRKEIESADLESTLARKDGALSESQGTVRILKRDCRDLQTRIGNLERECEDLQKLRTADQSDLESVRQKLAKMNLCYQIIEKERSCNEQIRCDNQATILNLKKDLERARGHSALVERKQHEEAAAMKYALDKVTSDFHTKEAELEMCKHEVLDLTEKLCASQELERHISTNADEVSRLRDQMDGYKSELVLRNKQNDELLEKLLSAEKRENNFVRRMEELNEALEHNKLNLIDARKEISRLRDIHLNESAENKHQIASYKQQISILQEELSTSQRHESSDQTSSSEKSVSYVALTDELGRKMQLLNQRNEDIKQLSKSWEVDKFEKERLEQRLFSLKSDFRRFQLEAKEKIGKILQNHNNSGREVRELRSRNWALEVKVQQLVESTEKLRHERDACFASLATGRDKIAAISSKFGQGSSYRHVENLLLGNANDYQIHEMSSNRAEEVAACLAISAKNSIRESHDESFQLRSHVYRLEEEKEVEVSSLRARIRLLENQLVQVEVGNHSFVSGGENIADCRC